PQVYFVEQIGGKPYVALEYIEGKTLRHWIEEKKLNIFQILDISIQFCTGMIYISKKKLSDEYTGMLHRDIKPENILITDQGEVKITDFGLAKPLLDLVTGPKVKDKGLNIPVTSKISGLAGTIPYMSPEQLQGNTVLDIRSDIFSFGVVMYEMITSERPFKLKNFAAYKKNIMKASPTRIEELQPQIPEQICSIVMKCLENESNKRYNNFTDLRDDLLSCYQKVTLETYPSEKLSVSTQDQNKDPDILFLRAISATQLNKYEEANSLLDECLEIEQNWRIWHNKGMVLISLGRYSEATQSFDNAIENTKDTDLRAQTFISKSSALINLEQYNQAIECCNYTIKIAKKCRDNLFIKAAAELNKGNAFREQGKFEEALDCYDKSLNNYQQFTRDEIVPSHKDELNIVGDIEEEKIWYNLGLTLRLMGQYEKAFECQENALKLNPRGSPPFAELGYLYLKYEDYENAFEYFKKAVELNKNLNLRLLRKEDLKELYRTTDILESEKRYSKALTVYNILVMMLPTNHYYWTARGLCLAAMGLYEEAFKSHDRAISLDPSNYQPWINKAAEFYELGRYQEALTCVDEVLRLNPQHPRAPILREMCIKALS
ncbi:MAG: tetratricopeptide repeat protein, partial [Candidatus Hermodarchaeota archaeon]